MAERFKQMKDLLQSKDMFQSITVSDYLFTKMPFICQSKFKRG